MCHLKYTVLYRNGVAPEKRPTSAWFRRGPAGMCVHGWWHDNITLFLGLNKLFIEPTCGYSSNIIIQKQEYVKVIVFKKVVFVL